jgi:hypothetical protein
VSDPDDLALHGTRVLGFASASRIASRFGIDAAVVEEALLDFEARGWVQRSDFSGSSGWSLTERGRPENERRLRVELEGAGAHATVADVHAGFLPLNRRFGKACTSWQIRPTRADPLQLNDHTDWAWDERVLEELTSLDGALRRLCTRLVERLQRFDGYADRYSTALARVDRGERRWVDAPELDSCHTVWVQLHEDLLATLGVPRGSDA